MCWAERASQPGCILLTGWNRMSSWMQFAERLIPASSESVFPGQMPCSASTCGQGLFCSGRRRMCCLYRGQAKVSHVTRPKYPVTHTWSLSHPLVSARVPARISPSHKCLQQNALFHQKRKKKKMAAAVLWIIWQRVPLWICAREPYFVDGCEEQVA